ncbi:MAG: hypothetical protein Q8Q85_13465, partial [Gemmatimonadales bacterium]|nr:hypothetical protein [Gemmatimonadales bacterium]
MRIISVQRLTLAAVLITGLASVVASVAEARPERPGRRPAAQGFRLFAEVNDDMDVNRVYCGIRNIGETCVDITGSPVLGGGSWPRGTADQYVFNSGLQIAGVVSATAGFEWAGDIVGSWFMDPRGDQQSGEGITAIYNSLNAADLANWPSAGYVKDTSLFASSLIGTPTASQLDLWWRYWDGNPNQTTGRPHPAGILVEQRGMGWNFPSGNEDVLYFIYRFINVTAKTRSLYDGLSAAGYTSAEIDEIAAIGAEFQRLNENKFAVQIPDGGYALDNLFAAIFMDPDVGDFLTNYSTGILPFATSLAYVGDWTEPAWAFPSNIFTAPFAAAPGFVGVKYLKSPLNPNTTDPDDEFGITIFSNTSNGPPFPDAQGIEQMYRYLSGGVSPALGDNSCTVTNPQLRHLCALVQVQTDTRFFMSSGPFTLNPGESSVIVVAFVFAPPVATAIANFVGGDMKPGIPPGGGRLLAGTDTLRNIDRAVGWVSHSNINGDTTITQDEVTTVPGSLLDKLLVAQAVFDNRFLLPFAPDAPDFFPVPGDNEVTIVWRASATEDPLTGGDPYYQVAKDSLNPDGTNNALFDRNYREFDVEGYRIWRGRTAATMEVIAQYDYATTSFDDYTGTLYNTDYGTQCAPEVGLTTSCPPFPNSVNLAVLITIQPGVVQIPTGGRVVSLAGTVVVTEADTAVTGGATGYPNLTDTGVPFAYLDRDVRNGFRYVYAVTAFDVNSVRSTGVRNTSLESPRVTKAVTPRVPSGQGIQGTLAAMELIGADGSTLDRGAAVPAIDPATGIFAGPMPPTDGLDLGFGAFLPDLLANGSVTVTIDSIIPGSALDAANGGFGSLIPTTYWFTGQGSGSPVKFFLDIQLDGSTDDNTGSVPFLATALSTAPASVFGGDSTFSLYGSASLAVPGAWRLTMMGRADANDAPDSPNNGPRWWAGAANENTNDPNGLTCPIVAGTFTCSLADLSRNAGAISGVDIFAIQSYYTVGSSTPARGIEGVTSSVMRAADFKVYWGASGAIDSVVDVTHRVRVPFSTKIRASYGILNDLSFVATTQASTADANNARLTWSDYACVDPIPAYANRCGGVAQTPAVLMDNARLSPVSFRSSTYAGTAALATTGNGFIFYLNGQFFVMQMAALPAAWTVWNARVYGGSITGPVGSYAFHEAIRPPAV